MLPPHSSRLVLTGPHLGIVGVAGRSGARRQDARRVKSRARRRCGSLFQRRRTLTAETFPSAVELDDHVGGRSGKPGLVGDQGSPAVPSPGPTLTP